MRWTAARSRRADILRVAEGEFGSAGYAGARMDRIALAARVNKQLLFHYFDSKDGLFAAALERLLARFAVPPELPGSPLEQIRVSLTLLQAAARSVPGFLGMLADAEANAAFPPAPAARLRAWRRDVLDRLTAAFADGQRRGYFRDDIDPGTVAATSLAAALGLAALGEAPGLGDLIADYCAWR